MAERWWKYWRRALATLVAMILIIEGMPLQTLAQTGRDSYIPLIQSEDDEEEEDGEDEVGERSRV